MSDGALGTIRWRLTSPLECDEEAESSLGEGEKGIDVEGGESTDLRVAPSTDAVRSLWIYLEALIVPSMNHKSLLEQIVKNSNVSPIYVPRYLSTTSACKFPN